MSEVEQLILSKLKKYDSDVFELADEALKNATKNLSEQTSAEQLENVVRRIVKNRGTQE